MDGGSEPERRRHTGRVTRYSEAVAETICGRIEAGESLYAICRDLSLPCYRTVTNWRSQVPAFGARYAEARARRAEAVRAQGRRPYLKRSTGRYHPALGEAICRRLASGESLQTICRDPVMPCYAAVMEWVDRFPEFQAAYRRARTHQAHALVDETADVARSDLAPADKQARIKAFTWMAAKLAPRKYGERPEPEAAGDEAALIQITVNEEGA